MANWQQLYQEVQESMDKEQATGKPFDEYAGGVLGLEPEEFNHLVESVVAATMALTAMVGTEGATESMASIQLLMGSALAERKHGDNWKTL